MPFLMYLHCTIVSVSTIHPSLNLEFLYLPRAFLCLGREENILKGSLDFIPSPVPLVKIQITGRTVCLWCKRKTLQGIVNKLL